MCLFVPTLSFFFFFFQGEGEEEQTDGWKGDGLNGNVTKKNMAELKGELKKKPQNTSE